MTAAALVHELDAAGLGREARPPGSARANTRTCLPMSLFGSSAKRVGRFYGYRENPRARGTEYTVPNGTCSSGGGDSLAGTELPSGAARTRTPRPTGSVRGE